ncbi:MAG: ACT domain-containing protein, partial [Halioglobus sp.]
VLDSDGKPITEDTARHKAIRKYLAKALHAEAPYPSVSERRTPRQVKSLTIPTETTMEVDEIKRMSVLEVSAPDRPGLLARIGQIFVDFNIELQAAKIQTLGERIEDVFFITDEHQQPIEDPEVIELIQRTIRETLDEQAAA